MTVTAFTPTIDADVLEDLRDRLRSTRWPDQLPGAGWDQGTDTRVLRSFVKTWLEDYEWRAQQERLSAFAHVRVTTASGLAVHAVHERAPREPGGSDPLPVVLLHGWPSSFVQMLPLLPMLTHPAQHGGQTGDAFHVVALSLPGYGFSDRPTEAGWDTARIADVVIDVMDQLGYPRFAARGSDLGSAVLQQLALTHPERLIALHLSGTRTPLGEVPDDLTPAEVEFVARAKEWDATEIAYEMEHSTKPQTLAHALNDSPVGLASWVLEKFRTWSDCGGDLDTVYSREDLLTNLTVYWATQTIASSLRLYYETAHSTDAACGRVQVPTGMAMSAADMFPTPREWAERTYDVVHWTELPRGGHFLEWEVPDLVAADMRTFFATYR